MNDEIFKHIPCGKCICIRCKNTECFEDGGCELHDELKCPQYAGDTQECSDFRETVNDAGEE